MGLMLNAKKRKDEKKSTIYVDGIPHVWMDGYKATDENMRCKGYQYDFNKEHVCDGNASICDNGFHFCPYLKNTMDYYYFNGKNRYFKVKALVPSRYLNSGGEYDKYVAKKIIFLEEVGYDQLKKYIDDACPLIKSEEDWINSKKLGYDMFCENLFKTQMSLYGYGEAFISILSKENDKDEYEEILEKAKAFHEEKVSKDMAVYMLLNC